MSGWQSETKDEFSVHITRYQGNSPSDASLLPCILLTQMAEQMDPADLPIPRRCQERCRRRSAICHSPWSHEIHFLIGT